MGCNGSKVDDQPLVILCKERKQLIKDATYHRSALSAAHLVYFQSLSDVGDAIRRFSNEDTSPEYSPLLTLPSDDGKPNKPKSSISSSPIHSLLDDDEDSHLHLTSGSGSESGSDHHIHVSTTHTTPQHDQTRFNQSFNDPNRFNQSFNDPNRFNQSFNDPTGFYNSYQPVYQPEFPYGFGGGGGGGMYYMKKSAPESVPFIFKPENHRVGLSDPGSPLTNISSTWDFLNVFDTYDYSNGRYRTGMSISSSPDSREVREREGIPELEEVTDQVVTRRPKRTTTLEKVQEHRHVDKPRKAKPMPVEESSESDTVSTFSGSEFHNVNESSSSNGVETVTGTKSSKGVSFELEETTTSFDVESSTMSSLTSLSIHATRDIKDVVKEIKSEFEVASSCGKEVGLLLEVSKLPYLHKHNGFKVILSRFMYLVAPSTRSQPEVAIRLTSRTRRMAKEYNEQDGLTGNLSSTLETLYAWEKKLYKEVKNEEKLRAIYEEKCRTLKKMYSHGAEASKIEATRAYVRKVLTKIDISIKSVDSISRRIHQLRDEELQPQLTQLIYGLIRMWRSMLKCHQKQFHAIMESKVRSHRMVQKDSGSRAILDLEMELREWCNSFNNWVNTQKAYVQSLHGWLSKCLHYEPEATEDGIAPFSPSSIGAPPIFIICKDWQEAMFRVSGENVSNVMQGFASNLHELWEKQEEEEQRLKAESEQRDVESDKRSVVSRGRSESGISALDDLRVDLDSMSKKLVDERGKRKVVNYASSSSLKSGLVPIFEALRKFTAQVVKAHEIVRLQYPQTSS